MKSPRFAVAPLVALALIVTAGCMDTPVSPVRAVNPAFDRSAPQAQVVVWLAPVFFSAGTPFQVVVLIQDQPGQASHGKRPITVAVANGGTGLSGTLRVQSSDGSATFTDLVLATQCPYELVFSAPDAAPATLFMNSGTACR